MKRVLITLLACAFWTVCGAQSYVVSPSFDQHAGRLAGYDFSARRSALATISDDQSLRVWKLVGGELYLDARVDFPTEPGTMPCVLTSCKFHPLADYILVGYAKRPDKVTYHQPDPRPFSFYIVNPWSEGTLKIVDRKGALSAPITDFVFSPDTRLLAVTSSYEHVLLYDADSFSLLEDIFLLDEFVSGASFTDKGELVISTDLYLRKYHMVTDEYGHFISCDLTSRKKTRKKSVSKQKSPSPVPEEILRKALYRPESVDLFGVDMPTSARLFDLFSFYNGFLEDQIQYHLEGTKEEDYLFIPYMGIPSARIYSQDKKLTIYYPEKAFAFTYGAPNSISVESIPQESKIVRRGVKTYTGRWQIKGDRIAWVNKKGEDEGTQFIPLPCPVYSLASCGENTPYLIASLCDGTIRWYDTVSKSELLCFFITKDNRWFFSLPNGYYYTNGMNADSSDDFIEWKYQVNNSVIVTNARDLKERDALFSERRVKEVLNKIYYDYNINEDVYADNSIISAMDTRGYYPYVSIDSVYRNKGFSYVDFSIHNYDPKRYGPYSLTFEVDDHPISPSSYSVLSRRGGKMTLSLDSEKALNLFYVSLKSSIGNYQTSGQYNQKIPFLFTISCAISDYSPIGMRSLISSETDASHFLNETKSMFGRRVVARRDYKLFGANVSVDTLQTCLRQIKEISRDENQVLIFYYSGHGAVDSQDDTWIMKGLGGDIDGKSILSALGEIPGYKIVVLDACYSGLLAEECPEDMAIITSSDKGETSLDGEIRSESPFTKKLIGTLRQTFQEKGSLSVEDLCSQVTNWRIGQSLEEGGQTPQAVSGDKISTLLIFQ